MKTETKAEVFLKNFKAFENAAHKLSSSWDELEANEADKTDSKLYPFSLSFDELASAIEKWRKDVEKNFNPQPPMEFTFYKGNRVDQAFTLNLQELKDKYLAFLNTKEPDWITYYGHQTVVAFINSTDGLNSTPAQKIELLQDLLTEVRHSLPCYK